MAFLSRAVGLTASSLSKRLFTTAPLSRSPLLHKSRAAAVAGRSATALTLGSTRCETTISAGDARVGDIIEIDGAPMLITARAFSRTAQGRAYVQATLRRITDNVKVEMRFRSDESLIVAEKEPKTKYTVLFTSGDVVTLMHGETFEQIEVPISAFGDNARYLQDAQILTIEMFKGNPAVIDFPLRLQVTISSVDDLGNAVVQPGDYVVKVPRHLKKDDVIVIDTTEGKYVSKA